MKRLMLYSLSTVLLGVGSIPAVQAQTTINNPSRSVGGGNVLNYPSGSRVFRNGAIQPPSGTLINPNVTITNGDGSTTFYYPNGTRIRTNRNSISPSGSYLTPYQPNGGLKNPAAPRSIPPFIPGRENRGIR